MPSRWKHLCISCALPISFLKSAILFLLGTVPGPCCDAISLPAWEEQGESVSVELEKERSEFKFAVEGQQLEEICEANIEPE